MTLQDLIDYNRRYIQEYRLSPARCRFRGCHAPIYWVRQESGSFMPCNLDGSSHFASCPGAAKFRRIKAVGQEKAGGSDD